MGCAVFLFLFRVLLSLALCSYGVPMLYRRIDSCMVVGLVVQRRLVGISL